jgi:hypothetical protein
MLYSNPFIPSKEIRLLNRYFQLLESIEFHIHQMNELHNILEYLVENTNDLEH